MKIARTGQWLRRITVGQIIACILAVAWMVFANFYFNREAVAKRSLNQLARNYYETYFYDEFLAGKTAAPNIFGEYAKKGFPNINLRQLLTYDKNNTADFYHCNPKQTTAKITPHAPWGRKDYTLETTLDCPTE